MFSDGWWNLQITTAASFELILTVDVFVRKNSSEFSAVYVNVRKKGQRIVL